MFWWRNRDESSVQQKSNSPTLSNDVDVYQQDYINQHRNYFDKLLGGRLIGKKVIEPLDITILKEAYDKAHVMRSFEIDLFWKRAGYCFTIIAALIALCGVLLSSYFKDKNEGFLYVIVFVSFVGVIFTILSTLMIVSGEYWKKNWELHISMLEPLFSGHIYSTHLVSYRIRASITKMTLLFFIIMYACWIGIIGFIAQENIRLLIILMAMIATIAMCIILFSLSGNKSQDVFITTYSVRLIREKNDKEKFKAFVIKTLIAAACAVLFIFMIDLCIKYYFFSGAIVNFKSFLVFIRASYII